MRNRLLSFGLAALFSCGLFSATGAFAQDRGVRRGPGPDPVIVSRTELLRRMDTLYEQIRDLNPDLRYLGAGGQDHNGRDDRDDHGRDDRGRDDHGRDDRGRSGFDGRGNDSLPQVRLPDVRLPDMRPGADAHDWGRRPDARPEVRIDPRFAAALASLEQLRAAVERAPSYGPAPLPCAMDEAEFQRLIRSVRAASFSGDKADLIREVARREHFSSEQAYALVALVPFSSDQVEAAVALYEHVIDPERFYRVYDALRFSSTRTELRRRLHLDR